MLYRQLGRTGLKVSQLGFGAMRLPMHEVDGENRVDREKAIPMIHKAFEGGVNYIDSAVGYCNKDSQRAVGDALKGWRDKIIVSTKNHYYGESEKDWWQNLEDSLRRLQVDYIDVYNHHGLRTQRWEENVKPLMSKWMQKAKDQGLIKHICFSMHDNSEFLKRMADEGYADVVTLQYNMLDRSLEDGIAYAAEKGMGIVVMGPVAGGRLGENTEALLSLHPEIKRVPELALRFVLSNPNVSVALSGMSTMQHVEENLEVASKPADLTEDDMKVIEEQLARLKKLEELYCTGCGYCVPCPSGVDIPRVFNQYNRGRVYGLWSHAQGPYNRFMNGDPEKRWDAALCTECGACEDKCPQNIPIREQLKEAHAKLVKAE
ncbi:MAG: aldo/keto reductase [Candidatus Sumerlaeia bacterium]